MKSKNTWDAEQYNKHAGFVSNLALDVVTLLDPKKDEKILDLGCGDGTLAVEIKKKGAKVVAVDLSETMVEKARAKGIDASVMSATELSFTNEFDAVFSNAVLHWVKDAKGSIEKIYEALKHRGRFVAEFGGYGNIKYLTDAMQEVFERHQEYGTFNNPWSFHKVSAYQQLLEAHGFKVDTIELFSRPTKIDDISNWLDIFANGITANLTQEQNNTFTKEVRALLKPKIYGEKDGWVADYVRLRLKATKY